MYTYVVCIGKHWLITAVQAYIVYTYIEREREREREREKEMSIGHVALFKPPVLSAVVCQNATKLNNKQSNKIVRQYNEGPKN